MTPAFAAPAPVVAIVAACAGMAFGALYFAALKRSTAALAADGGWVLVAASTLARIAAAAAFFWFAAKIGAVALLAAFVGFLAARFFSMRNVRKAD